MGASRVTLSGGKATVTGNTSGAKNEFSGAIRCGAKVPLAGPQHYYKVDLTSGRYYRFTLTPQFEGALYIFSECSQNIINSDCSSGGKGGDLAGPVASGKTATLTFTPDATGTYFFAVDSASVADAGTFTLNIEELSPPTHATCKTAKALTLSSGAATVTDTTLGAANEFSSLLTCGLSLKFKGPQVYYSLSLTKGQWYRFSLTPDFSAALWLANAKGNCSYNNINVDCGGIGGTVLPLVAAGKTGQVAFAPLASGSYILAVDSLSLSDLGNFTLKVESFVPTDNMVCSGASKVTLASGKGIAKGTTVGAINDRGAHVTCGSLPSLVGGQRYHSVDLLATAYRLQLKPQFSAVLAVGKSCLSLPADCGSSGLSGGAVDVGSGSEGTVVFTPSSAGTYVVAVDSGTVTGAGSYELLIQEDKPPKNGTCGTPSTLHLGTGSPASELGNTAPLKNDLAGVKCGHSGGPWSGPGAYFKVSLLKGKTYTVTVTPEKTFDPALYAFPAATACDATSVNAACKGQASDKIGAGVSETLTIAPSAAVDMILVVDSWSASEVGRYTLSLSWK